MTEEESINKIYYQLLRERDEKICKAAESFAGAPPEAFDLQEARKISEDARTRYMIKAAAIFIVGELG